MMDFLEYGIKTILCSGILMLYYFLFLRNRLFHQWNRIYLLLTIVLSLVLPSLTFEISVPREAPLTAITLLQPVAGGSAEVETLSENESRQFTVESLVMMAYCAVTVCLFIFFVFSIYRIVRLYRQSQKESVGALHLAMTDIKGSPFSFFRLLFWNRSIDPNSVTGLKILEHELTHIRQGHSYDKVLVQLVLAIAWINPFFWIIRKELQMVHEFIADQRSAGQGEGAGFAAMVLSTVMPQHATPLVNSFFQSPIKRRIMMINKTNKFRLPLAARIFALPVLALTAFAFTVKTKPADNIIPLAKPITVVIDAGHGVMENGGKL